MANPVTGDFDAILQVSGGTINRLLASMHQNGFTQPKLPSFPHTISIRVGDDRAIDGVRGHVQAQLAVPQIDLIHGATDRFVLVVGVRARYTPDYGTAPLPAFIHGIVRAEYRIEDIDPHCLGWAEHAAEYLWIRVVKDSVRFEGTANEDVSAPVAEGTGLGPDPAAVQAANATKITRQIAALLLSRFAARPHQVSAEFRRGRLRSLETPIGGSAVALAVAGPAGAQIGSIDNLILEGRDVATGVSRAFILSLAQPALDAIASFAPAVDVRVSGPFGDMTTVYNVHMNPPSIEWQPQGWRVELKITASGTAQTNSVLPNVAFKVTQVLILGFDADSEVLRLTPGERSVTTDALTLPDVLDDINAAVLAEVKSIATSACDAAQSGLDSMLAGKQRLITQLRTIDDQANVVFDQAVFVSHGLIIRGTISLSRRKVPVVRFEQTVQHDGYTALQSWIPGGRIDSFEWSWSWLGPRAPGAETLGDRFVLKRPRGRLGRWGGRTQLSEPLAGIDGPGRVCLRIKGVQVHGATGQLVPVESVRRCYRFGLNIAISPEGFDRLLLRDLPELSRRFPPPELALVEARAAHDPATATNTLVLHVDRSWNEETAVMLRGGLDACRRGDAGLVLLVLFRDGALAAGDARAAAGVEDLTQDLGLSVQINEDVNGSVSAALRLGDGGPSWRLIGPHGNVTWSHEGRATPEFLGKALDAHLVRSAPAKPARIHPGLDVGTEVSAAALDPGFLGVEPRCPPLPIGQAGVGEAVITFVRAGSASSEAHLRQMSTRYRKRGRGAPLVLVIADGADAREVDRLKREVGFDFDTLPDRDGRVSDRCGVRVWPTTLSLNASGIVSDIEIGASASPGDDDAREKASES